VIIFIRVSGRVRISYSRVDFGETLRSQTVNIFNYFIHGPELTLLFFSPCSGMEISAGPILHTSESRATSYQYVQANTYGLIRFPVPCLGYVVEEQPRRLPIDPSLYVPHLTRNTAALALIGIKNPISLLSKITRDRESITLPDGTVLEPPAMGGKGRKVVILGDTYDATRMSELCLDADVVIHEATNAFMPTLDPAQAPADPTAVVKKGEPDKTQASVRQTAKAHGHSTPEVAGEFAKLVRAKSLILNHISNKYCQPVLEGEVGYEEEDLKRKMIEEIGRLATVAWGREGSNAAIVTRDFMEIKILRSKS
jgi:ribonuclease Z